MHIKTQISVSNFRKNLSKFHKMAIDGQPVMISKSWDNAILINFHLYKDLVSLLEELLNGVSV